MCSFDVTQKLYLNKQCISFTVHQYIHFCITCVFFSSFQDYEAAMTTYNTLLEKDPTRKSGLLSGMGRIYLQVNKF